MFKPSTMGLEMNQGSIPACILSPSLRNIPRQVDVAKHQGRRFLIAGFLSVLAVCLASGLLAFIVLEAFDSDLDLWPFGSEDFSVAPHGQPANGGLPVAALAALSVLQCMFISAGAHLVLRHRARSALPADSPILFSPLNMAEPRVLSLNAAPVLGHFFCWGRSDNWNKSARARLTHLGLLSRAFRCAYRSSS